MIFSILLLTFFVSLLVFFGFILRSRKAGFYKQLEHGMRHLKDGETYEAETHFRAALQESPGETKSSYAAAMRAYAMHRYEVARPLLAKCLEIAPGSAECW